MHLAAVSLADDEGPLMGLERSPNRRSIPI